MGFDGERVGAFTAVCKDVEPKSGITVEDLNQSRSFQSSSQWDPHYFNYSDQPRFSKTVVARS